MRSPLGYVDSLCGDDSHEACGCGSGKVHGHAVFADGPNFK